VGVEVAVAVEVAWVRASASFLVRASVSFLVLPWLLVLTWGWLWLLALTWGWPSLLLWAWACAPARAWFQAHAWERELAASGDGWARLRAMRRRMRMGWVRLPRGDRPALCL